MAYLLSMMTVEGGDSIKSVHPPRCRLVELGSPSQPIHAACRRAIRPDFGGVRSGVILQSNQSVLFAADMGAGWRSVGSDSRPRVAHIVDELDKVASREREDIKNLHMQEVRPGLSHLVYL